MCVSEGVFVCVCDRNLDAGRSAYQVIAGKGLHSREKQKGKLVAHVKHLLRRWHKDPPKGISPYEVLPVNQGSFLVRFELYCGPSPCFGVFFCHDDEVSDATSTQRNNRCGHTWDSTRVIVDICKDKCEPAKYVSQIYIILLILVSQLLNSPPCFYIKI